MKRKFFLIPLCLGFFSHSAVAGTMGSERAWVASLSLGPVWQNAGTTETFYLAPDIEKSYYVADNATNALFAGEIFFGIQKILSSSFQGQLGLAVAATSNATLSGVILDDAGPEFNNYSYSYKIQHTHIAAKGKVLFDQGYWLMPWISGSIGVGFNYAHSFQNTPLIYEAVPTPNFTSETKTSFTYTVGAGVQKALSQQWQVGVGYEFADWGQSSLGRASGQTLNSGLSLNHLYTNGLMFNLTYVA